MYVSITALILTSVSSLNTAHGTPVTIPHNYIALPSAGANPGNIGGLYICTEKGWIGACTYVLVPRMKQCWNLSAPYAGNVSSFGTDKTKNGYEAFFCSIFEEKGCAGMSVAKGYPGSEDLEGVDGLVGGGRSFSCRFENEKLNGR
jgi:hypothetical protein